MTYNVFGGTLKLAQLNPVPTLLGCPGVADVKKKRFCFVHCSWRTVPLSWMKLLTMQAW